MHHHRRPGHARRDLQIADQGLALERKLDHLERRREMFCGLAEQTQRMAIGVHLAGRARDRIARDAAVIEGEHIKLGKLVAGSARLRARVGLGFVVKSDLAPQRRQ
jgi:hypothetical protein